MNGLNLVQQQGFLKMFRSFADDRLDSQQWVTLDHEYFMRDVHRFMENTNSDILKQVLEIADLGWRTACNIRGIVWCACGALDTMQRQWNLPAQKISVFCQGCEDQCPSWRRDGYELYVPTSDDIKEKIEEEWREKEFIAMQNDDHEEMQRLEEVYSKRIAEVKDDRDDPVYHEAMQSIAAQERQHVEETLQALPELGFIEFPTELRGLIADYVTCL